MIQIELVFRLFTAIFLGVLSTKVVLLFNNPVTTEKPFKDFTDLATKIIEGKVHIASMTELTRSRYSDPVWLKRDYASLYQGLKTTFRNKPILNVSKSAQEIMEFLGAFPIQSMVVVVPGFYVNSLKNRFCGLDFLSDDLKNTAYRARNSNDVIYPASPEKAPTPRPRA